MSSFLKYLAVSFGIVLSNFVLAKPGHSCPVETLMFQVGQEKMLVDYSSLQSASANEQAAPIGSISIELTPEATEKFSQLSARNIGKPMCIFLNDRLISCPVIRSSLGGSFVITGPTKAEAEQFVEGINCYKHKSS